MFRTLLVVLFCFIIPIESNARIINTINFTGVDKKFDSEAEYRLLQFAQSIVITRARDSELSLAVKAAYGASLIGDMQSHNAHLDNAYQRMTELKLAWSDVAQHARSLQTWLNGRLRPEYAEAFKEIVADRADLQKRLVKEGASAIYMDWAFAELETLYKERNLSADSAIIQAFLKLEMLALENIDRVNSFENALEDAKALKDFQENGLYGHIFDFIAMRADKPRIFTEDERYFAGVTEFDIFYEALEQVSREAHKLVPQTHDLEFENFNLKFTPEVLKPE